MELSLTHYLKKLCSPVFFSSSQIQILGGQNITLVKIGFSRFLMLQNRHKIELEKIRRSALLIQPVSYKRHFRCNNCFLLLVYTIHLPLSTNLVDPPPMGTIYMKHPLCVCFIKGIHLQCPLKCKKQPNSNRNIFFKEYAESFHFLKKNITFLD